MAIVDIAALEERIPTPEEITSMRESVGMTCSEAADLLHSSRRAWQTWENGAVQMHPVFFAFFKLKVSSMPLKAKAVPGPKRRSPSKVKVSNQVRFEVPVEARNPLLACLPQAGKEIAQWAHQSRSDRIAARAGA